MEGIQDVCQTHMYMGTKEVFAMMTVRQPAVAGRFYPANPEALRIELRQYLQAAAAHAPVPKAIIVPHAGYIYSGPIAASAYARLTEARGRIRCVVLLGPAHWVPLHGVAVSSATAFATPLGSIPIDQPALARIMALPQVSVQDEAHAPEHSLEVQLPFLQTVLDDFALVPIVVGEATPPQVGEVLELLWNGPQTLIVVSSDLSHYYDYDTAQRLDQATARAIEALRPQDIRAKQACGRHAITGLLHVARQRGLHAATIDLRNSGDTAGPREQVVGYGAFVFAEP